MEHRYRLCSRGDLWAKERGRGTASAPGKKAPRPLPDKVNCVLPAATLAYTHLAQKKGSGSLGEMLRCGAERQAGAELPLENYDSLTVEQISERLGDLSVEEIRQLQAYEAENKSRSTLLWRLDERIEAASP